MLQFAIGLFIGAIIGFFVAALVSNAKDDDE